MYVHEGENLAYHLEAAAQIVSDLNCFLTPGSGTLDVT